jgi:hypothetical protein
VKDQSKFIWDLPDKTRLEVLALGRKHLAELAANIAYFAPPFEYLKTVRTGFDPSIRFLLDRCLAGDPLSLQLRDAFVTVHKNWFGTTDAQNFDALWREFGAAHETDLQRFIQENYPWLAFDPNVYDERRFQRDPKIDDYFNAAVLDNLGSFGFKRLSRSFKSTILSRPMVIKWDKGTWSMSMTVWLQVPTLAQQENIAMPFAFSGVSFDFSVASRVEARLQTFFAEYGKLFPDVLSAVEQQIKEQEAWLDAHR